MNLTEKRQRIWGNNNEVARTFVTINILANLLKSDNCSNASFYEDFSDDDADLLANWLKTNTTLKDLYFLHAGIKKKGFSKITEALKSNAALTVFSFHAIEIGVDGGSRIGEALKINATLTYLDLSRNNIGDDGGSRIAEALKINSTLAELKLFGNNIGNAAAKHFAEALKINTTLCKLDISSCENIDFINPYGIVTIGDDGYKDIAAALKFNVTLTDLTITYRTAKDKSLLQTIHDIVKKNKQQAERRVKLIEDVISQWLDIVFYRKKFRAEQIRQDFKTYYFSPEPVTFSDGSVRKYGRYVAQHMKSFEQNMSDREILRNTY